MSEIFRDTRIRYLPYAPADRMAVTQAQMNIIRAAVRPNTRTVFVYLAGLAVLPPLLDRYLRIFLTLNGFKETRHRYESCRVSMWTLNGAGPTA